MLKFVSYISNRLGLSDNVVKTCFALFEEGHAVPFIARYRSSSIQNVDPDTIFNLESHYRSFEHLEKSRQARLIKLAQRGLLNPKLQNAIENCVMMEELDELWAPFKPEKKESDYAKASSATRLLDIAYDLLSKDKTKFIGSVLLPVITSYPEFKPQQGILAILMHTIVTDSGNKEIVKKFLSTNIIITSNLKRKITKEDKAKSNFKDYDDYNKRLHQINHHQLLALRRGKQDADELTLKMTVPDNVKVRLNSVGYINIYITFDFVILFIHIIQYSIYRYH